MFGKIKDIFFTQGIDTITLIVSTNFKIEEIEVLKVKYPLLKSINRIEPTRDGYKKIVFQISNHLDRTRLIDNVSLLLDGVKEILKLIDGRVIELDRVDIALDSKLGIEKYNKLATLIVLCTSVKKRIDTVFRVQGLFDLKNKTIKLGSSRFEMTFYSRADKQHTAQSRLEIRYKRQGKENWEQAIEDRVKDTIELFNHLETNLEVVEEKVARNLIDKYFELLQREKIKNFTDFAVKYEEMFYTKGIFDKVYIASGIKPNSYIWLREHRRRRQGTLKFISCRDVKKFTSEIKRKLKVLYKTI